MPDETVIDGEVVALDADGRPSFNMLQNYASGADLHYFIFDPPDLKGQDVMGEPLTKRRKLLEKHVFPEMVEPIRHSPVLDSNLKDLIQCVKAQGLEGWWRSAATASMKLACARVLGRRCGSTGGKSL
jgi:bifunctional non-homologous end joining protein LigD